MLLTNFNFRTDLPREVRLMRCRDTLQGCLVTGVLMFWEKATSFLPVFNFLFFCYPCFLLCTPWFPFTVLLLLRFLWISVDLQCWVRTRELLLSPFPPHLLPPVAGGEHTDAWALTAPADTWFATASPSSSLGKKETVGKTANSPIPFSFPRWLGKQQGGRNVMSLFPGCRLAACSAASELLSSTLIRSNKGLLFVFGFFNCKTCL